MKENINGHFVMFNKSEEQEVEIFQCNEKNTGKYIIHVNTYYIRKDYTIYSVQTRILHPNRAQVIPLIERYLDIIINKYQGEIIDVILYGSVARGEDKNESDIDLLIIGKENNWELERDLIDIAYDTGLSYGMYLSVKYISLDTYTRQKSFILFENISREGVSLVS
ncbi:MAG TPA: nucleotidyltransferase domain-containing protein [Methanospirillum sp.]|uniref:nucleotidyltransferase domain-containing protein n=1 Tax=Methanospirillum sp. TaxID=45200 RepID=UPI001BD434C7|nr:nucleotidyltransferase domain-containing protein [Methanospirillum sp.]